MRFAPPAAVCTWFCRWESIVSQLPVSIVRERKAIHSAMFILPEITCCAETPTTTIIGTMEAIIPAITRDKNERARLLLAAIHSAKALWQRSSITFSKEYAATVEVFWKESFAASLTLALASFLRSVFFWIGVAIKTCMAIRTGKVAKNINESHQLRYSM
jgi:hypothetical protein